MTKTSDELTLLVIIMMSVSSKNDKWQLTVFAADFRAAQRSTSCPVCLYTANIAQRRI